MTVATTWQEIRALRSTPTGITASDAARRRTFVAALRQAEELAEAAAASGYAAMPLPQFYSLSQAGRAIAAAHLSQPWQLKGHGLSVAPAANAGILDTVLTPKPIKTGFDAYSGVAAAINSPSLNGPAQLGALWAANPDLRDVPVPTSAGSWPRALEFRINRKDSLQQATTTNGTVSISVLDMPAKTGTDVTAIVDLYPSLRGSFGLKKGSSGAERAGPNDPVIRSHDAEGNIRVNIGKPAPTQTTSGNMQRLERSFASYIDECKAMGERPPEQSIGRVLPEVGGGTSPFPLLLWWALLLGLSSLARYHPDKWTAAIDPDSSGLAVSLERVLDVAKERVPQRILQGLTRSIDH